MSRRLPILIGILIILGLLGAVTVSFQIIEQHDPEPLKDDRDSVATVECIPDFPRLTSPFAVLALDVSGSMITADPNAMQLEAALRFYDLYRDLAAETLKTGDTAQIAVLLFATIPQLIVWDDNLDPWLPVTEQNTEAFHNMARRFLEPETEDPRRGHFTDHAGAIRMITRLISGLTSPPLVIFMTDGASEPYQPLTPLIPIRVRQQAIRQESPSLLPILDSVADGQFDHLGPDENLAIFDFLHPLHPIDGKSALSQELDGNKICTRVQDFVSNLMDLRFPYTSNRSVIPPYWIPLFLGSESSEGVAGQIRNCLVDRSSVEWGSASSYIPWLHERPFVYCQAPADLVPEYVAILAKWMRLKAMPLSPNVISYDIPSETQSYAISLQLDQPVNSVEVASEGTGGQGNGRTLQGSSRIWSSVIGNAPSPGAWSIMAGPARVSQGAVFLRPRYEWVFRVPDVIFKRRSENEIALEICLYSVENRSLVPAGSVFHELPESIAGSVAVVVDNSSRVITFSRGHNSDTAAYKALMNVSQMTSGKLVVSADLTPMRDLKIVTTTDNLRRDLWLNPGVFLLLQDEKGQSVGGIRIQNVPSHSTLVRQFWSWIRDVF